MDAAQQIRLVKEDFENRLITEAIRVGDLLSETVFELPSPLDINKCADPKEALETLDKSEELRRDLINQYANLLRLHEEFFPLDKNPPGFTSSVKYGKTG